jgi:ATP-dependent Clp protease ATP-binding subunit ClpA
MQIEKYTDRLKTLIQSAQSLAQRSGHQQFSPLHMLEALLDEEERFAANLLEACGASVAQMEDGVDHELGQLPKVEGQGAGQIYLAPEMARVFDQAEKMSRQAGDSFVTVEYMLMARATKAALSSTFPRVGRDTIEAERGHRQCPQRPQGGEGIRRGRLRRLEKGHSIKDGDTVTVRDGQLAINRNKLAQAAW